MIDTEHYSKRLTARRAELVARMNRLEDWLDDTPNPDTEERATEREQDEVFEAQGNEDQKEVRAIDAALQRIENGVFGICMECGEEISKERLDAVPYTTRCRNCMT
ncbi:MAG: dimethylmenaquinone methyltransferase [Rhizobiaceae bacterium MnEN-MB40S]|nr:MAG: dimethylmenaquinone methyltransferase [Rhizobiaceae bacterium MnEN-MB40S]